MSALSVLNNREIAAAIWSLIAFLWALSNSSIRKALFAVVKAFLAKKIIIPFVLMLLYILVMIVCFEKIGFWDASATKDTILWTAGSALVTFVGLNKIAKDESYFKNTVLDNIKLVAIIEFIVNLYAFSLIIELALFPAITAIVILNAFAESKSEYKRIKTLLDSILGILGVILIIFTLREILTDVQGLANAENLRGFFLPPLLTIAFLPFIYLMALYMQYESLFIRVDFANRNSGLARYVKWRIFTTCHAGLSRLIRLSKNVGFPRVSSKDDVLPMISTSRNGDRLPEA